MIDERVIVTHTPPNADFTKYYYTSAVIARRDEILLLICDHVDVDDDVTSRGCASGGAALGVGRGPSPGIGSFTFLIFSLFCSETSPPLPVTSSPPIRTPAFSGGAGRANRLM